MGLSSSLNTSVIGLAVNATKLSGISDNIANANTLGYKRVQTEFTDVVLSGTQSSATYTSGGVRAYVSRDMEQQGSLEGSTAPLDIAIAGQGFLSVSPTANPDQFDPASDSILLSTTGSFKPDAAGYVRTQQGQYLLGWKLNESGTPILNPVSRDTYSSMRPVSVQDVRFSAARTSSVTASINLPANLTKILNVGDATDTVAKREPSPATITYYDNLGAARSLSLQFTPVPLGSGTGTSNDWVMSISDSASVVPNTIVPATSTSPASTTLRNPNGVVGQYRLSFYDTYPNSGTLKSVRVFDPDGTDAAVSSLPSITRPSTTAEPGVYTPPVQGSYNEADGKITVNVPSGSITIRIGKLQEAGYLQQFAGEFTNLGSRADNGTAFGTLTNYQINDKGILSANFSNGSSRPLYKIPVANVVNASALVPQGQNTFALTRDVGNVYLWDSGEGPVGKTQGSTLMRSNVDVAQELTGLIETQRAYASNAKVVQTVDEMLQTTTEIKR